MSYVRQVSPYSTNQGNEKICWAHSIARLISRLIKIHFGERQKASDEFMFDEGELLDEYYDTINCSSQHTIFHCIAHTQDVYERKGKLFSIHKSLNKMINWESENLSALLFHFILNCLKNKYGCAGLKFEFAPAAPIFYFLKLIHEHITEEKIKDILNYYDFQMPPFPPPPEPPLPDGWQARMSRTKNRPYWINTLTGKKTRKDPRGVVPPPEPPVPVDIDIDADGDHDEYFDALDEQYGPRGVVSPPSRVSSISPSLAPEQSTLGRIAVVGGGLMEPTFRQVQENKVMFLRLITKLASLFELLRIALEKKTLKINLFVLNNLYDGERVALDRHGQYYLKRDGVLSGDFYKINDKGSPQNYRGVLRTILWPIRAMWFKRIIQVLEQGLYVLLGIYKHAILITGIEGRFFIVKNSWGSDRDWILPDDEQFIVDNKLSISTLIKQSKTTAIELVYIEFETPKYEIFTKKKLPNKSIIHTFKKTAKRLSRYFGKGRKIKKIGKKTKKYYNKK